MTRISPTDFFSFRGLRFRSLLDHQNKDKDKLGDVPAQIVTDNGKGSSRGGWVLVFGIAEKNEQITAFI